MCDLRYRLKRGFGSSAGRSEQVKAYQDICLEAEARIKELEEERDKWKGYYQDLVDVLEKKGGD